VFGSRGAADIAHFIAADRARWAGIIKA